MSAHAIDLRRPSGATHALCLSAGGLLLLARVEALGLGSGTVATLAIIYCILGAVSVAPAVGRGVALLPAAAVTLVGAAAVAAVSLAPWQRHLPGRSTGAVIGLGVLAAIAEEAFFRRLLYDRLVQAGAAVAIAGSALVFALVHLPLYGTSVFWLDLGAGFVLSWQRWAAGTWVAPAVTHSFANVLAAIR
jgi:membrane protease YdiL (CAAX protease family)